MEQTIVPVESAQGLAQLLQDSHTVPLVLFKHSQTCGVSAQALDELTGYVGGATAEVRYAMVTVQTHRDLSNAITDSLGIRHETPQVILIREGRVVWTASHYHVNSAELDHALTAAAA